VSVQPRAINKRLNPNICLEMEVIKHLKVVYTTQSNNLEKRICLVEY